MKSIIHKADTRGHSNYGWLDTHYTFSFANYYNPERINFGTLRVLNDDLIEGGQGFGRHPHDNMEIITIPLEGELEHKDSMGYTGQIRKNEVQVMTAGTGIFHSEYNHLPDTTLNLLQIWVFPSEKNLEPRYDQKEFDPTMRLNQWQRVVSPNETGALQIHQEAYFSLITLESGKSIDYKIHNNNNGIYLFIIDGSVDLMGTHLERRDGIGIWDISSITLTSLDLLNALLMEIPMKN
jgi:quercetin 2,3-dioxygenase